MNRNLSSDAKDARIGVGLVGAGLVTQSIHIPVLAGLAEQFAIRGVWDLDSARADEVAESTGARPVAGLDELLADTAIDVVAVCTPAALHGEHAIAAMRAGKRAVLVEKPVGNTAAEVEAIAAVAGETGAALIAGSMHLYDHAWQTAMDLLSDRDFAPRSISSRIVLPPNERFIEWAFEPFPPATGSTGDPWTRERLMRVGIMELAIHDLPLVRRLLPLDALPRVTSARLLRPFGYALNIEAGGVVVDLMGLMHGHWQPDWKLEAVTGDGRLELDFTPSFVHAGSGTARWHEAGRSEGNSPAVDNGYVREWRELARILSGDADAPDPVEAVRDYRFACAIAEQANALLVAGEIQ